MSGHSEIPAERRALCEGKEIELLAHILAPPPGSPREWVLDPFGAPEWIVSQKHAELAPWGVIVPLAATTLEAWRKPWLADALRRGPAQMPRIHTEHAMRLAGVTGAERRSRGHPGLEKTERELIRWCAWMIDVREVEAAELLPFVAGARGDRRNVEER